MIKTTPNCYEEIPWPLIDEDEEEEKEFDFIEEVFACDDVQVTTETDATDAKLFAQVPTRFAGLHAHFLAG